MRVKLFVNASLFSFLIVKCRVLNLSPYHMRNFLSTQKSADHPKIPAANSSDDSRIFPSEIVKLKRTATHESPASFFQRPLIYLPTKNAVRQIQSRSIAIHTPTAPIPIRAPRMYPNMTRKQNIEQIETSIV